MRHVPLTKQPSPIAKAAGEGEVRPGPWYLPITGGWLPADVGSSWNWWQLGYDPIYSGSASAMVEACIAAYSQTVAMCPGDHWVTEEDGGRERITTSALSRILRKPNSYQSPSDFMLNATRSLYADGNAYALAIRNDRFEVAELHLMQSRDSAPILARTGDLFYRLGGNDIIERQIDGEIIAPARDVLHIRLHTSRRWPFPLVGETPLAAAMMDVTTGAAITQQQIQYYLNQARPSAVLSTDLVLDKDQVAFLRDRWDEQSKGLKQGGTPILTAGLKVQPWGASAKDAELAEVMKISDQRIALAYRVPLQILGLSTTPLGSTEALMQAWIASGLGFALNHIEDAFGRLFALKGQPDEYVEFDTAALLRSAFKDRIEALARAVQGGIFSPNEARAEESLPEVEFGDEPRVQQQVVPLSAAAGIPSAPAAPGQPPAPGAPKPDAPAEPDQPPPSDRSYADAVASEFRTLTAIADRYERSDVAA